MSSASVTKAVAKKLKYYLDVRRREDGFDLSGPLHPKEEPIPLRVGPTLDYDGIHDRSLKHYFHNNNIKRQLQKMHTVHGQEAREGSVRGTVDHTMASVDYRLKPGPISPYALPYTVHPKPPAHRPQAQMSVEQYLKTKKGSKRRKFPPNVVGKPRRILRRSPPQRVSPNERERLVNMASKLIVATETVALPATKKQSKGFQAPEKEFPRLQRGKQRSAPTESVSSDSEGYEKGTRHPTPPKGKPRSVHQKRPESSFFKSSPASRDRNRRSRSGVHVVLPGGSESDDDERLRSLIDRMNLDGRGSSVIASPHQASDSRPKSAGHALKSAAVGTDEALSEDDDFDSEESSRFSSTRITPRVSWMDKEHHMIDISTQTVVHSGTQTVALAEECNEPFERQVVIPLRLSPIKRNSLEDVKEVSVANERATYGASTSDMQTSLSTETQTRNRDLEPNVLTYEVYVLTGDKLGAGTKAVVKLTLFGEYGNSGERQLLRSRTHRTKFQRGQVDIFVIDSVFVGKLSSIRIGHSETKLGYGWFLERVFIKEGSEATRAFTFNCDRWLSSRDDDGQIIRDLPVTDIIPASHLVAVLPRIDEKREDFFSSGSESESFSSEEEENTAPPKRRETKIKEKSKGKAEEGKLLISTIAVPAAVASEAEREGKGFVVVKAENLFDISEGEEGEVDENTEDEKKGETVKHDEDTGRFFTPEEDAESDKSEDERTEAVTTDIRQGVEEDEQSSDSEEEEDEKDEEEEEDEEEGSRKHLSKGEANDKKISKTGADDLRLVSTSVSAFLQQPTPKVNNTIEGIEGKQTENVQEEEKEVEKKPRVEFTEATKQQGERERPLSAQSDEFVEGFKAGIRAKHERERERHRESISESENVFRKGSSIHDAAKAGDLERIKELAHVAPSTKNSTDERGMNPLHIAAANGRLDCVKWLAVSGVDLSEETPTGYTAMHLAAMNGHVNCMMILSAMGSTLNCRTIDEFTPLHLAAMSGFIECVKWLIANRANVEVEDTNGRTPLDIAEEYGHEEVVKLLKKFKRELTRQDSTLSQLMISENKRRKSVDSMGSDQGGVPSKVSDSGVGGLESGEDSWISDTEEDIAMESLKNANTEYTSSQRSASGKERPTSASRARTDSITTIQDKKVNYDKQRSKMKKRNSSFLDSIRMEVENEEEF